MSPQKEKCLEKSFVLKACRAGEIKKKSCETFNKKSAAKKGLGQTFELLKSPQKYLQKISEFLQKVFARENVSQQLFKKSTQQQKKVSAKHVTNGPLVEIWTKFPPI